MKAGRPFCFVIMPFAPEFHYFHLYLQQYLAAKHNLRCERGDNQVLTIPVLEKVSALIQEADMLIADCSGRNPNVFYELGIAHAHGKPVILITRDELTETPSDIRHLEFIRYRVDQHLPFFERLDNALHHLLMGAYDPLYARALRLLKEFRIDSRIRVPAANKQTFIARMHNLERDPQTPPTDLELLNDKALLPNIFSDEQLTNPDTLGAMLTWLSQRPA